MRYMVAVLLLTLFSVSGVLAQTPEPPPGMNSSVVVTVITSENGTNDNLQLELSGTFPGDPMVFMLDQPGDLQPGMVNTYSFIVPHTFCEMFQFKLTLAGSDDWQGQQFSIQIDGAQVYYDGVFFEGGTLSAGGWRGGTWDRTSAYRDHCATTPVSLEIMNGSDGTVDNPVFYLQGDFSASPYSFYMDQPGDLQPGMTNTYNFDVPMSFCQMTGWKISKGTTGGIDDSWQPNQITINVDGSEVFYDGVFYQVGPITSASNIGGTWDGTSIYQNRCPMVIVPPGGFQLLATPTLVPINPGQFQPLATPTLIQINPGAFQLLATATPNSLLPSGQIPINPTLIQPVATLVPINPGAFQLLATPTLIQINPGAIKLLATPTPVLINPGQFQPLATPTPAPFNPGVTQCLNAPPPRLHIGGQGRVTLNGVPNRIRSQPNTSGTILGQIPSGGVFSVIGGPNCDGTYAWWQVNYNGVVGWTAEGTGSDYFVEPM